MAEKLHLQTKSDNKLHSSLKMLLIKFKDPYVINLLTFGSNVLHVRIYTMSVLINTSL